MAPSWNPEQVLDVYTQSRPFHCVGTTKQGARCQNSFIKNDHLRTAQNLLDGLPELSRCRTDRAALLDTLETIAWYTLCPRWHQSKIPQADDVAQKWLRLILDLEARTRQDRYTPSRSSGSTTSRYTSLSPSTSRRSSSSGSSSSGHSSDSSSDGPGYSMFRVGSSSYTHSSRESGFSSSSGRTLGSSTLRASNSSNGAPSVSVQASSLSNGSHHSPPRAGTVSSSSTSHNSTSSRGSGVGSASGNNMGGNTSQANNPSSRSHNSTSRNSGTAASSGARILGRTTSHSSDSSSLSPVAQTRHHWSSLPLETGTTQPVGSSQTPLISQPPLLVRSTQPAASNQAPIIPRPPLPGQPSQLGIDTSRHVQRPTPSSPSDSASTITVESSSTTQRSQRVSLFTGAPARYEEYQLQTPMETPVQPRNGNPSSTGTGPSQQPRASRVESSDHIALNTPNSTHVIQVNLNITISGQRDHSHSDRGSPQTPTPASRHNRSSTSTSSNGYSSRESVSSQRTVRSEIYSASRGSSSSGRSPVVDSTTATINEIIEALESVVARFNSRSAASSPSTMGRRPADSVHTPISRTLSPDSLTGSPSVIYTPSSSTPSSPGQNTPESPFGSPIIVNTSSSSGSSSPVLIHTPSSGSSSPVMVTPQSLPDRNHTIGPPGLLPGENHVPGWRFNLYSHPN